MQGLAAYAQETDMGRVINRVSVIAGERRMTIAKLASKTGVAHDTISRLWYGKTKRPDLEVLGRVCSVLKCQVGDLFVYVQGLP